MHVTSTQYKTIKSKNTQIFEEEEERKKKTCTTRKEVFMSLLKMPNVATKGSLLKVVFSGDKLVVAKY